mmetsp:Transcript_18377/g.37954  ORF Transcript_18377/g.37954 Transcript_18377/m.37954 type:complete len:151 (+) Transcript_18377:584-1036(+)
MLMLVVLNLNSFKNWKLSVAATLASLSVQMDGLEVIILEVDEVNRVEEVEAEDTKVEDTKAVGGTAKTRVTTTDRIIVLTMNTDEETTETLLVEDTEAVTIAMVRDDKVVITAATAGKAARNLSEIRDRRDPTTIIAKTMGTRNQEERTA